MSNEETTDNVTRTPNATISTFGSFEKETTNQVRYSTGWGVVYIPKTQVAKLSNGGYPENVKITVAVQQDV